jgi:hypothetical protein
VRTSRGNGRLRSPASARYFGTIASYFMPLFLEWPGANDAFQEPGPTTRFGLLPRSLCAIFFLSSQKATRESGRCDVDNRTPHPPARPVPRYLSWLVPRQRIPAGEANGRPLATTATDAAKPVPEDQARFSQRDLTRKAHRRRVAENWAVWRMEVGAILLPAFFVFVFHFVKSDIMQWAPVASAISQGVFLIPTMLLSGDAFRRWWNISADRLRDKLIRRTNLTLSWLATALCLLAGADGATIHITATTGDAITTITFCSLIAATLTSTWVVIASNREVLPDGAGQ